MSKRKTQQLESIERRSFSFEVRSEAAGDQPARLVGHAAVFNRWTTLIPANYWWDGSPEIRERIDPGAFSKTLKEGDARAIWNHNTDIVLGRKRNKTLFLSEDSAGLACEIVPPDTALVRDMVISPIDRGDVDEMSFGFRVVRDSVLEEDNMISITLKEIDLREVSPCTMAQYTDTDIGLSSRSRDRIDEFQRLRQAAADRTAPGQSAHPEQQEQPEATPAIEHPAEAAPLVERHLDEDLFLALDREKAHLLIAA